MSNIEFWLLGLPLGLFVWVILIGGLVLLLKEIAR